jgi:hypothetical protein
MLPKIDVPIYELTLPSNGKVIKIRPYLVKEDMILLMAAESKEPKDILLATKQVVTNCVLEDKFDVDTLSMVDFDYIFVNLRARSVGQDLKVQLTCKNKFPFMQGETPIEVECNTDFEISYDLENVQVFRPEPSKNKRIMLSGSTGVEMKFPTFALLDRLAGIEDVLERELQIIIACVDKVFDRDSVVSVDDSVSTIAEMRHWIENLTTQQFQKIKEFIENLPYLKLEFSGKCPHCDYLHKFEERKILDFF